MIDFFQIIYYLCILTYLNQIKMFLFHYPFSLTTWLTVSWLATHYTVLLFVALHPTHCLVWELYNSFQIQKSLNLKV
jgi:hypothetical protein